jgi:cytochrome oxidase Cu insertion factor (SCO1/SenC/PrrC family)
MKLRALAFSCLLTCALALSGQQAAPIPPQPVALTVPDIEVVNQFGEHAKFNTGVVKGRVAVIAGFFTSCTAMCPITQENMAKLAKLLGDRMGREVVFISLSTDAANDTPQKMKAWGEKFHVGPGWTLASGNKDDVDTLLKSLGLYVEIPQRHQSALIIGNQANGWVRASSWSSPENLVKVIDAAAGTQAKAVSASTN